MDDLISRQAAIDAVDDVPYIKDHPNIGLLWKAWIEQLPSAQPDKHLWFMVGETLVSESKRHITAEQAIIKIRQYMQDARLPSAEPEQLHLQKEQEYMRGWEDGRKNLMEKLPSAKCKTGYWVWADGLRCSECGYKLMQTHVPQLCPHCHSNNGGGA